MTEARFRDRLAAEFQMRRAANPRYSLRAFAAFLGTDHSTISQIIRSRRRAPSNQIRRWAHKLGMDRLEASAYIAAEHVPEASITTRELQLRHWTAEAMSIVTGPAHFEILRLCRRPDFHPDCRWLADRIAVGVDEVNLALSRLLRLGLLELRGTGEWKDLTGISNLTENDFRKLALARIRERAAADKFGSPVGKESLKRG